MYVCGTHRYCCVALHCFQQNWCWARITHWRVSGRQSKQMRFFAAWVWDSQIHCKSALQCVVFFILLLSCMRCICILTMFLYLLRGIAEQWRHWAGIWGQGMHIFYIQKKAAEFHQGGRRSDSRSGSKRFEGYIFFSWPQREQYTLPSRVKGAAGLSGKPRLPSP